MDISNENLLIIWKFFFCFNIFFVCLNLHIIIIKKKNNIGFLILHFMGIYFNYFLYIETLKKIN